MQALKQFDVLAVERLLAEQRSLDKELPNTFHQLDYAGLKAFLEEGAEFFPDAPDSRAKRPKGL